jgi:hypothetical protein
MSSSRKGIARSLAVALLGLGGLALIGCTSVMVQFPVDGAPTEKYFALTSQEAKTPVVEALRKDDLPGALKLQEEAVKQSNAMPHDFYRLAVLYEASSDWDAAEKACNDGIALDKEKFKSKQPPFRLTDELKFIAAHRPKK